MEGVTMTLFVTLCALLAAVVAVVFWLSLR